MVRTSWTRRCVAMAVLALLTLPLALAGCSVTLQSTVAAPPGGLSAPVHIQRDFSGATLVLADVMISGKGPFRLAVDTGASITLVDRSVAEQAQLRTVGGTAEVSGVGGTQRAVPISVQTWSLGDIRLPAATIARVDSPLTSRGAQMVGLLGSDVLSHFGTIAIDYNAGRLTVYQKMAIGAPAQPTLAIAAAPLWRQTRA